MKETFSPEIGREVHEQLKNPEVTAVDIDVTAPEIDGTKIIMQRHERYIREESVGEDGRIGGLTEGSAQKAYDQSKAFIEEMLSSTDSSGNEVEFLVVGSNTRFQGQGQRSIETAQNVLKALNDIAEEGGIGEDQILNNRSKSGDVAEITRTQAPRFLDDSPEYLKFLEDKYGVQTQEFWKAFEEDTHHKERIEFGAEGPDEMDARFASYLKTLSRFSEHYHKTNSGKRLVIWSVSHYDTISPYIKRHITKTDPHQFVPIDYGAGVSLDINSEGDAFSNFKGRKYNVDLKK